MIVFAVSVTSTPKASLAGAGVAALGAGGGGGGPSGAGIAACANADEATPSASNAARAAVRPRIANRTASQKQVIEISLDRKSAALPARGARIGQIYHGNEAAE
jgi:hypothetical protein